MRFYGLKLLEIAIELDLSWCEDQYTYPYNSTRVSSHRGCPPKLSNKYIVELVTFI